MPVTPTAPFGCSTDGSWKKAWGPRNVWTKYRLFRCILHRTRDAGICRGPVMALARCVGFDSPRKRNSGGALPDFRAGPVECLLDPALEFRLLATEPLAQPAELPAGII